MNYAHSFSLTFDEQIFASAGQDIYLFFGFLSAASKWLTGDSTKTCEPKIKNDYHERHIYTYMQVKIHTWAWSLEWLTMCMTCSASPSMRMIFSLLCSTLTNRLQGELPG